MPLPRHQAVTALPLAIVISSLHGGSISSLHGAWLGRSHALHNVLERNVQLSKKFSRTAVAARGRPSNMTRPGPGPTSGRVAAARTPPEDSAEYGTVGGTARGNQERTATGTFRVRSIP